MFEKVYFLKDMKGISKIAEYTYMNWEGHKITQKPLF